MIEIMSAVRSRGDLLAQLQAVSPQVHLVQQPSRTAEELAAALANHPNTEVLYTFQVPRNALELAPGLRWVQLHSAGADHLLNHPIAHSSVAVTTVSGIHATSIAEYVMASILARRWRVPYWIACQRRHEWPQERWNAFSLPELRGCTLGILGYGSIGREVGRLGHAFGMRVLVLRRSIETAERGYTVPGTGDPQGIIPERFYRPEELREMLAECDFVVVALPLTAATTHLIGEAALRAMKPTAYLVNVARGAIVDEDALIRALREKWIAGAGLDVFEEEPLPAGSPLWDLDNALISPHVAGHTPRYEELAGTVFAENLRRYVAGEPLLNLVDWSAGY